MIRPQQSPSGYPKGQGKDSGPNSPHEWDIKFNIQGKQCVLLHFTFCTSVLFDHLFHQRYFATDIDKTWYWEFTLKFMSKIWFGPGRSSDLNICVCGRQWGSRVWRNRWSFSLPCNFKETRGNHMSSIFAISHRMLLRVPHLTQNTIEVYDERINLENAVPRSNLCAGTRYPDIVRDFSVSPG